VGGDVGVKRFRLAKLPFPFFQSQFIYHKGEKFFSKKAQSLTKQVV
jgi:hypothetical protein